MTLEELKAKLLSRIAKREDGCWMWLGSWQGNGYGNIRFGDGNISTHRASWMVHKGEIPKELCILHICDNRWCVNPEHLFLGTYQDNIRDMHSKGRANHRTAVKLTEDQVIEIRLLLLENKLSQYTIGDMFNVSRSTIMNIKNGSNWRSVKLPWSTPIIEESI